jgi:hypothetical protein
MQCHYITGRCLGDGNACHRLLIDLHYKIISTYADSDLRRFIQERIPGVNRGLLVFGIE